MSRLTFPSSARLRTRRDFVRIARNCSRHTGEWILVEVCPNRLSTARLGITATKKYGPSVARNRFKRIVREAYRHCRHKLPGIDINVRPRSSALQASMQNILQDFNKIFDLCSIL